MTDRTVQSWILELRARLAGAGDDAELTATAPAIAVFVPLFVGAEGLNTVLALGETLPPDGLRRIRFPSAEVEQGDNLWETVAEIAAEQLEVDSRTVLRLGVMAPMRSSRYGLDQRPLVPCLGAVPRFDLGERGTAGEADFAVLPLARLRSPHGLETARVELATGLEEVPVRSVAGLRLWGPASEVLDRVLDLLAPTN